ncbi:MAG: class I SAM-dependent methyltransferase [Methyloversatilis sp.]|uniref:class I SAM-dependent methyltransferase n=1 Tax=Methyloversatilis sp. TaxID=2569862 RepID=UPI0025F40659|nr:class I SAM-dependent methyltransferase [Methyloversatilis sp.]MCR6666271.1 class I SAM-dependent methyltransferase [Methyloversatilis sp.]
MSDVQPLSVTSGFDASRLCGVIGGYGSMVAGDASLAPEVTTDEYAADQEAVNVRKTIDYLLPMVQARGARTLLDVGCGVGAMVKTFLDLGYDAYGVDLPDLHRHWARLNIPFERMCVVSPDSFRLPFADNSIDFAYTLGVIEHVGTSNGHSDRLPDYHDIRRAWLREVFRVVRPGGCALIGGPNRRFPVDVAHDLDSRASMVEKWLSRRLRVSLHKTWGENFLWAYGDIDRYLEGLSYTVEPQSIAGFLSCGRVPAPLRSLVQSYIEHIPARGLGTGLNPWVMALVTKKAGSQR